MSLHAQGLRRLASTCAHGTVRRRRGVRCYVSQAPDGPAWFQQVRAELLSRSHVYRYDNPNDHDRSQLARTLAGFVPVTQEVRTAARTRRTLLTALCLTRFNATEPSAALLPDGTDALHWPGEPWVRRMWAGGAVQIRPVAEGKVPRLKLGNQVACVERIKDVRLQGEDDAAKIFVTVERRFASTSRLTESAHGQPGAPGAGAHFLQQVRDGVEWGDALFKEERHLVFLKAKTDAELTAVEAGHTHEPRYLKAPTDPDFSHTLTPTRALLFRYSALTFNAHLLHLDPSYARHVEGHRNLLVHGPLTLTLMLQVWAKHRLPVEDNLHLESIAYRNLAPLYCDEEMRVCFKKKTSTDAGRVWDVWIEGPTGGMAVKAVVRTEKPSPPASAEDTSPGTALPDVHTVAAQARQQLSALDQKHASPAQATSLSRTQRRKLWREQQRLSTSQPTSHALSYLYSAPSPLALQHPLRKQAQKPIRKVASEDGRKAGFDSRTKAKMQRMRVGERNAPGSEDTTNETTNKTTNEGSTKVEKTTKESTTTKSVTKQPKYKRNSHASPTPRKIETLVLRKIDFSAATLERRAKATKKTGGRSKTGTKRAQRQPGRSARDWFGC